MEVRRTSFMRVYFDIYSGEEIYYSFQRDAILADIHIVDHHPKPKERQILRPSSMNILSAWGHESRKRKRKNTKWTLRLRVPYDKKASK